MELTPGAVIAGRYRVQQKVGAGGMGEVWAGEHVTIGVKVALKKLLPAVAVDHQVVARFKREAYLLGRIRSEHVARIVDFVADDTFGLVLVMDFVEGEPLTFALEERQLGIEETIDLGIDIAEALCDLQRANVVHRDLKPDNIIMEPLPTGRRRAVLVDFGVSRLVSGSGSHDEDLTGITHADMAVGTIAYMAPEQLLSSRDVTGASDVYALGAILYRAVAGRHVFGDLDEVDYAKRKLAIDPERLRLSRTDRVANGFAALIFRSLKRQPAARLESASAMLIELTALRDLARALALDLEHSTDKVASSSDVMSVPSDFIPNSQRIVKVPGTAPVDPTSMTLPNIDRRAVAFDEQSTLDPTQKFKVTAAPTIDPAKAAGPPVSQGGRDGATLASWRTPVQKVNDGPAPSSVAAPGVRAIRISPFAAATALGATLVGGMFIGWLLHWGISEEPPAAAAPESASADVRAPDRLPTGPSDRAPVSGSGKAAPK